MKRLLQPACLALLLVASLPAAGGETPPPPRAGWTVVEETRLHVEGRLLLRRAGTAPAEAPLRLDLAPGRPTPVALSLGEPAPVRVGLLVTADTISATGRIRLRVEADVQPAGSPPARSTRILELDPGRAALVELWAGPRGERRVILACSATAEQVPRLAQVRPDVRPVDLVVEVRAGNGDGARTVQRLRLSTLVGSPARYALASLPGEKGKDPRLRVELELLPVSLRDGRVDLRARVSLKRRPDPQEAGPGDEVLVAEASTSGRLAPGSSLELPLPRRAGSEPTVFRVTVFF